MTAGETWTRERLAELRGDRYRPAAWRLFLASSFACARRTRAIRTREHRQLLTLAVIGAATWGGLAALGLPWLALIGAAWLALLLLMVDWHLGMLESDTGRPLQKLGAANLISLVRGSLAPALLAAPPTVLLTLLLGAGLSDAIDGPLARALGHQSRLGRFLDPGVDAFVLGAAAVAATRLGLLPWWAACLVLARYAAQWAGLAVAYFACIELPRPNGFVPWKLPGPIVFCGLILACAHFTMATTVVAAGALAGLATLTAIGVRSFRPQEQETMG
jgi:phosphatidylglycerophosphate synthase